MISKSYLEILKELLRVGLPLSVSFVGITLTLVVDRLCLVGYSEETLLAAGPAAFSVMVSLMFFIGVTTVGRSLIAERYGRGGMDEARHEYSEQRRLGTFCAVLYWFTVPVLVGVTWLSPIPELAKPVITEYLLWSLLFGAIMIFNSVSAAFFSAIRASSIVLYSSLGGQLIGIVATVWLVFGGFGVPDLGITGAALGTLLGSLSTLSLYRLLDPHRDKLFSDWNIGLIKGGNVIRRFRLGSGLGAQRMTDELSALMISWAIALLGGYVLGANNFLISFYYVLVIPIFGIASAVTVVSSGHLSQGQESRVSPTVAAGLSIGVVYVLATGFLLLFVLDVVSYQMFRANLSPSGYQVAKDVAPLTVLYGLFVMSSHLFSAAIQSFGRNFMIFRVRLVVGFFLSVPISYVIAVSGAFGDRALMAIWTSHSIFELVIAIYFGASLNHLILTQKGGALDEL